MGGACCKDKRAAEEEDRSHHLNCKLVRDRQTDFYNKYEVVEVIGEGSISVISKIKRREVDEPALESSEQSTPSDHYYALKVIKTSIINPAVLAEMNNEIDLLRSLDHPSILKVYEVFTLKDSTGLVMELCTGGDLFTRHPYSERQASNIVRQILSAATYLHNRKIVHRDLKYENIMFASPDKDDFTVFVIDFGLAKKYLYTHERLIERVGTIYTMAPEVTLAEYSGSQADMWSIGVITYMLLSGEKPFWANKPKDVIRKIREGEVKFESEAWKSISSDAKNFIEHLLVVNPARRMTARDAAEHPFISKSMSLSARKPDPEMSSKVKSSLVRYANSTDFKKIALTVVAKSMTPEEILDLRAAFAEFDTSNDGIISFDEFKKALYQSHYTEQELEHTFRGIDVNHTGNILYTEFLAAALEAKGNIDTRRLADAFHELDEDDSGYISRKNLRTILPPSITDEQIDMLIADVDCPDSDGQRDGQISFEEFTRALSQETSRKISRLYDGDDHSVSISKH